MFRSYFTNKWVLGCFCFLIVFGIACYFWYQHELAPYKQQAAETEEMLRQADIQTSDTDSNAEPIADTLVGSKMHFADKQSTETLNVLGKTEVSTNKVLVPVTPSPLQTTVKGSVSPHGFGPYPEVPDDYIIKPFSWDFYKNDPPIFELMARVRIKLWKQGIRTTGITSHRNGLVYPTIPGMVFLKRHNRDGTDFLEIRGYPGDDLEAVTKSLMDGIIPDGIQVRNFDEAGIEPYSFLNIKK